MRLPAIAGAALALLLGAACASPLGGEDIEISLGPSYLPGPGVTLGASQRIHSNESRRIDLEIDWTRQSLDDRVGANGRTGDSLDQVRFGGRLRGNPQADQHWTARGGVVWTRAQGDAVYLDTTGDFGGLYLGVGYEFEFGPHFLMGPDVTVHLVDSEGTGDSGTIPQLAWRLTWRL